MFRGTIQLMLAAAAIAVLGLSASGQDKEQPERTISRLEFRVVDVKPGEAAPVVPLWYRVVQRRRGQA